MKTIIMAAGVGTRISQRLGDTPKCCARIGDESLIQRTVRTLKKSGVHDISVIVGFKAARVREDIESMGVKTYENPFFDVTNSIASLWFARRELQTDDDVIVMNGDLFFEEHLIPHVIKAPQERVVFADPKRTQEADYRLQYSGGIVREFGKTLPVARTTGEYVGIAKIGASFLDTFRNHLEFLIGQQRHGLWWENVLFDLSERGEPIFVQEIADVFWAEIDYWEDYQRIMEFLNRGGSGVADGDVRRAERAGGRQILRTVK
ncbi:MAG TPA: phosphocholine cytidylyltransferase family protein [bacterium]|nr:phosphocholine cytidylyltransferase family protein [bacterium]